MKRYLDDATHTGAVWAGVAVLFVAVAVLVGACAVLAWVML